jgi:hypothetical protein
MKVEVLEIDAAELRGADMLATRFGVQGDAWASVIVQHMKGDLEVFTGLTEEVKIETAKGETYTLRGDAYSSRIEEDVAHFTVTDSS